MLDLLASVPLVGTLHQSQTTVDLSPAKIFLAFSWILLTCIHRQTFFHSWPKDSQKAEAFLLGAWRSKGIQNPIFIKESLFEDKRPIPGIHLFSKCLLRGGCDVSTTEEEEVKTKRVPCLLCKNLEVLWQYWPVHFESAIVYCQHTLGQAVLWVTIKT